MPYDLGFDPYVDEDIGILRNLVGARTQEALDEAEAEITSAEITAIMVEGRPKPADFTADLLLSIHRRMFRDIYDWAGQLRTVQISKGTTGFARMEYLQVNLDQLFERLKKEKYLEDLGFDVFVGGLAYYYGELIVIHPFREGNGRAIRTLLSLLAENAGWDIDWSGVDPEQNIDASVAAYNGDLEPMITMLGANITEYDRFWDEEIPQ
jgi:cell filamentation protein